jgi:hypothetical protein
MGQVIMANPLHSDACKCECDKLAMRLVEVIAAMKSNNGSHALYILRLEELLSDWDEENFGTWQQIPK